MRNFVLRSVIVTVALISLTAQGRAQLTLEVELSDLETWISNYTPSAISVDGYQINSSSGILDPVNWQSIRDSSIANPPAVTAALGSGALQFLEFGTSTTDLSELNFTSVGTWQPGTRWSIGFPFGTSRSLFLSRPFDASFEYTGPDLGGVALGSISLIPEPTAVSLAAIALVALAFNRRPSRLRV